jgi:hypothetical protein
VALIAALILVRKVVAHQKRPKNVEKDVQNLVVQKRMM